MNHAAHYAVIAILGTVVLGLLIFGLVTHDEPGFIEGAPQWNPEDLPLSVNHDGADNEAVEAAIDRINSRLGFRAFRMVYGQTADVEVVNAATPTEGHSEIAHVAGIASQCNVTYNRVPDQHLLTLVLYHELGHCLGLAHDTSPGSIMRPVQTRTPDGQIPPWFTDADTRSLIDRYGP